MLVVTMVMVVFMVIAVGMAIRVVAVMLCHRRYLTAIARESAFPHRARAKTGHSPLGSLEPQVAQTGVIIGAPAQRPAIAALVL
jgi:hypothetical protein